MSYEFEKKRIISTSLVLDCNFDLDVFPAILRGSATAHDPGRLLLNEEELFNLMLEIADRFGITVTAKNAKIIRHTEKGNSVNLQELNDSVTKLLITDYEFLSEEAEEAITHLKANHPGMWNENASPEDLAKFLASDESDD